MIVSALAFSSSLHPCCVFSLLIAVGAHPVVAADGDLDTSFGSDGKVITAIVGQ